MDDLITALGLVLVIEGLVWALSPKMGRRLLEMAVQTPEKSLQTAGWTAVAIGVGIVWLMRG